MSGLPIFVTHRTVHRSSPTGVQGTVVASQAHPSGILGRRVFIKTRTLQLHFDIYHFYVQLRENFVSSRGTIPLYFDRTPSKTFRVPNLGKCPVPSRLPLRPLQPTVTTPVPKNRGFLGTDTEDVEEGPETSLSRIKSTVPSPRSPGPIPHHRRRRLDSFS